MSDLNDLHWEGPDDSAEANRWRGDLFRDWNVYEFMWRDAQKGHYCTVERPRYVTFPICYCCNRVIWTWPHFAEPVEENAICDHCAKDAEDDAARDWP